MCVPEGSARVLAAAIGPWAKPHRSFLSPHPSKDKMLSSGEQERSIKACPPIPRPSPHIPIPICSHLGLQQ